MVWYQNSDMLTFGQRLRSARKAAKLTQAAAAKKAGMAQPTLSELENDAYPSSTFTPRLAHVYGVSARWLADGEGPQEPGLPLNPGPSGLEASPAEALYGRYLAAGPIDQALIDVLLHRRQDKPLDWVSVPLRSTLDAARAIAEELMPAAKRAGED
ncbi:helix-turn-helix domain-containing protein [Achromobacter ruhlandii]|uniref:helix-turn-helix domain-containing protein n=1 Tax=Achromobacter ruhlandii TaxID=72557 RepID=UPI000C2607D8|nr:helix-turn-helix domain-containing protein [Achromobacter ruhlandii]PJM89036.1 hypothetical protein CV044_11945 [Achromobacter ruhlandii]